MSSMTKKQRRDRLRKKVMERDGYRCRVCQSKTDIQVHHITDRHEMPNQGNVVENCITLCSVCHEKAEDYHKKGVCLIEYTPDRLYAKFRSDWYTAYQASCRGYLG
jgi:5-methylcytosine-specific restriction endonuclease McrA